MQNAPYANWRPHPWHGLSSGPYPPGLVHAYIEITPYDLIKYEVDKATGYLRVDRPQRTSSTPPTLYGFIPRTYCGERVGVLTPGAKIGDGDPLDICVISERPISRSEVLLVARVVGGIQSTDDGHADDKIIAVLENDGVWGGIENIDTVPHAFIERLRHYFSTYKMVIDEQSRVAVLGVYGREHAWQVIEAAIADYLQVFGAESGG